MSLDLDDTIVAIASAPGPAARGILRVSGPQSAPLVLSLFHPDGGGGVEPPRRPQAFTGNLRIASENVELPARLYLWPTQRSYTGQPAAELHTIGCPPLLEAALSELTRCGARVARPGEFTLRAFLAGRLDLVQAEAVLGVIDAHDHEELRVALEQLGGGVSTHIGAIRDDLLNLLADLEAGLDFVEEDIQFISTDELAGRLRHALESIRELAAESERRMTSRGRNRVVLAGLPNAGKSTLFNALTGRSAALVSPERGTTRDYLAAEWDCHGATLEIVDTAGWETAEQGSAMHSAGRLRDAQYQQADLILWCTAADPSAEDEPLNRNQLALLRKSGVPVLEVRTKIDRDRDSGSAGERSCKTIGGEPDDCESSVGGAASETRLAPDVAISVQTGVGLERLAKAVAHLLDDPRHRRRQWVGATAARCRESLEGAAHSLAAGLQDLQTGAGGEIVAVSLHDALEHLGQILGAVYTDDILDRIFSRFCIGK